MTTILILLTATLFVGMPVAFAFGLSSIFALMYDGYGLLNVPSRMFAGLDSFVLLAAPFYILAGEIMNRGGISERLIELSRILVGRIKGGTAYAAIVAAVMFSGISGTAVADIAALGQIFINAMPKEGYSKAFAAALITAASVIGPIIPPSVIMVLYAAVSDISVLNLFLAGVVPGLLLGLACGGVVFVKGLRGELPVSQLDVPREKYGAVAREGAIVLSLPGFIVFGTTSGVFTATEAGGIAVIYAIILSTFVFRSLDRKGAMLALRNAARLTASLFLLIATVEIVNYVLIMAGIGEWTAGLATAFAGNPQLFMIVCVLVFLLIGLALDAGPALLLLAPFLLPVTRQMGIDDIHFSMVMIVCCTLGLISPPVGICLFVACKIGNLTLRQLWHELRWFFYAQIAAIIVMVYFPILSTGLPRLVRGYGGG